MLIRIISVLLLLVSCKTGMLYERPSLFRQRLVVRKDYPGKLTNQVCIRRKGEKCEKWDLVVYDLKDPKFRVEANELGFVCQIGGKRWRICVGIGQIGYCRRECLHRNKYSFKCYKYEHKFIHINRHDYLYKAETTCRSFRK